MSHDLWLWFSSLLVLEKTFENRRDELLSGIYQNFFISVRILSIMHQNLTWVGLPSLCWCVTEVKVLYLLPSVSVWSYSSLMIWNHFIGAEAITYRKINWWNTSLNIFSISSISRRLSLRFNELFWLVHLLSRDSIASKKDPPSGPVIRCDYYTTLFVL